MLLLCFTKCIIAIQLDIFLQVPLGQCLLLAKAAGTLLGLSVSHGLTNFNQFYAFAKNIAGANCASRWPQAILAYVPFTATPLAEASVRFSLGKLIKWMQMKDVVILGICWLPLARAWVCYCCIMS